MAPPDIGLEEIRRKLGDQPKDGQCAAACVEIVGLRIAIGVELVHLLAEGADRKVMDRAAQPPDGGIRRKIDAIMHRGG